MLDEEIQSRRRKKTIAGIGLIIGFAGVYYLLIVGLARSPEGSKPWAIAIIFLAWTIVLLPFLALAVEVKRIVMKALHAVPFPSADYPQIDSLIEDISVATGLNLSALWFMETEEINAYAVPVKDTAAIVLTGGLVEKLGVEEKRAVLAHEIARIHREFGIADRLKVAIGAFPDMLTAVLGGFVATLALTFILLAMTALVVVFPPYLLYVFTGDYGQLAAYFLMLGIFSLFTLVLVANSARNDPQHSQERFYQADRLAVKWTMHPEALVSALLAAQRTIPDGSKRYKKLMAFVPAESPDAGGASSAYRHKMKGTAAAKQRYRDLFKEYLVKKPPRTLYFPTVRMRIERLERTLKTSLD